MTPPLDTPVALLEENLTPMSITVNKTEIVQAIGVWRPDGNGRLLSLCACVDRDGNHVAEDRRRRKVNDSDGIIGEAAQSGEPIIRALDSESELAIDLPPSHVVAIPFMRAGECRGVVLLACDRGDYHQAGFEVWRPNGRGELGLAESWHPNLERFGRISQHVKFPRRAGLPGKVWADRFPRVMGSLGTSQQFVRMAGAKAEGLSAGMGISLMRTAMELGSVVLLLSSSRSPIAHVMEVWAMDPQTRALTIVSADYSGFVDLAPLSRRLTLKPGEGIAGRVFRDQAPWLTNDLLGVEFPRGERFVDYGFRWGVGMPIFVGNELRAVATLIH